MEEERNLLADRVPILDVLKGICILIVIMTHYEWESAQRLYGLFPFWVDMAVPVFMMISGFVYAGSFQKNKIEKFENAYAPVFILKKVIRYTIPFSVALTIEFIFSALMGNPQGIFTMGVAFLRGGMVPAVIIFLK